jgi:DnaK suppressor protein
MFVSFLQRFGFLAPTAAAEPLKSLADRSARPNRSDKVLSRKPPDTAEKRQDSRITQTPAFKADAHPQASAQRRQDVKAPAKKTKPSSKVAAKQIAKQVAKPVAKQVAKPAVKPAPKAAVKPAAKSAIKPAAKPVAKKAVKPVLKAAVKATAPAKKLGTKGVISKKPVTQSVIKPVAKPIAKPAAKTAVKPVQTSVPPSSVKSVRPSAAKAASIPSKPVLATQPAAPPVPKTMITPPPPLKPGRRSSARTAAQSPPPAPMVPTHAPDAAKASYSTITERVISPPPHVAAVKDPKLANNWKTKNASELTDDEVKAMPDSEYMNDKQLAFFRHKLSILKSEIHASAGQTTENLREDTVVVPDPADRATIEEEHALELRTRDRERKLLKKIEQSISRIDAGDYGYCDETGEAIGVGRLIARPTASLSLEAQQRRELKQKLFGD